MSETVFPRMALLQSLYDLTGSVSSNRFIGTRPNATGKQMNDFLLISMNGMADKADTYQLTGGKISVFARDIQGGLENTLRLERMQEAVMAMFPIRTDLYLATRPKLLAGGSDGAGFHFLIIQFNIRIHKPFNVHPTEIFKL